MTDAPAGSARADYRARRQAARETKVRPYRVPGYDPPLVLLLRPITEAEVQENIAGLAARRADPGYATLVKAAHIARATVGVCDLVDGEHVPIGDNAQPVTFGSERLWDLFGIEPHPKLQAEAVLAVFPEGLHITACAEELIGWSGLSGSRLGEAITLPSV